MIELPKASARDRDGSLAIAKFPHKGDEWSTVVWEAVALSLADRAGLTVPIGGSSTLPMSRY